ncbi:threonine/serine exporter family protein [Luedemannella flava]|uniref:Threonine/serine exporter family protein n=1 Tax=Luedemannella flava TaxID=349316 RepID=A0ABP4YNP6_9ACTN
MSWGSVVVAAIILTGAGLVVVREWRAGRRVVPSPARSGVGPADVVQLREFLSELGIALNATGTPVTTIVERLRAIAVRFGVADPEIVVLPTLMLVGVPGEYRGTVAVRVGVNMSLRLDQIAAVIAVADDAEAGRLTVEQARRRLTEVPALPPPYGPAGTVLGYTIFSLGLAMFLQPTIADLLAVTVLGAGVGLFKLGFPRLAYLQIPLPVLVSFLVSLAAFLLVRADFMEGPIPLLAATLVGFLPGSTLTTGIIDISAGEMIAGSGRLVVGVVQLGLLVFGIIAAAQVVGLAADEADAPVGYVVAGAATPWIGVFVFAVGVHLHLGGAPRSLPWSLAVLYAAYTGQVLGAAVIGATMSGFLGAVVMVVVAALLARFGGPAPVVAYLPAFWLLVPGALGLVTLTQAVELPSAAGIASLMSTAGSVVSIALGVLVGAGVVNAVTRLAAWRT